MVLDLTVRNWQKICTPNCLGAFKKVLLKLVKSNMIHGAKKNMQILHVGSIDTARAN
jgi:hypothetical protein